MFCRFCAWLLTGIASSLLILAGNAVGQEEQYRPYQKLRPVNIDQVAVRRGFWAKRLEVNHQASIPHVYEWCQKTGRISNFDRAASGEGKFEGLYFNDSDVYKLLEGMAYVVGVTGDKKIESLMEDTITRIAKAQLPDGYLDTYYILGRLDQRWTNCAVFHELYCAGHMFEAAVAHYRATGRRNFLNVATRLADHIASIFGPDKRYDVPGHEEIEIGLVKLYEATGEKRYLDLAKFFIDIRGVQKNRPRLYGPYCQDHLPVRQQDEIVGHAVRAMYLYSGVADVYAWTDDNSLLNAMNRIWQNVTLKKLYITGGVGARHAGEAFGDAYELPNVSAYCETCAAIGLALWANRMALISAHARYADVLERVLYNGFASGVSLDGKRFFYVNPLESTGNHHRQPFYGCACCPTNVVRFVPQVPTFAYAHDETNIFVNLFMDSQATFELSCGTVQLEQETDYPWDGRVAILCKPKQPARFALHVRIPGWCKQWSAHLAGVSQEGRIDLSKQPLQKGYLVVDRVWQPGDKVELEFTTQPVRIVAHPNVIADRGRVAIQRGPVVYCFEGADNGPGIRTAILARAPELQAVKRPDLLGGVVIVTALDRRGKRLTAVPYFAWDNREPGPMIVWIRQEGLSRKGLPVDEGWTDRLYRELTPDMLGEAEPPTIAELATPSASHCFEPGGLSALNDLLEPRDSCDHSIPRFTWWDHRGTKEWVQYDFDKPYKVHAVEVYWFDDRRIKRHCRVPSSWQLFYRANGQWVPVEAKGPFGTAMDRYNRVEFEPVVTDGLRIEVQLDKSGPWSGGILEWKVEGEVD